MFQRDIEKLQSAQMLILHEVRRLCREHGLTYYLIGGTLLGAVRHSGFIPWDIDIDVAMFRSDYERFIDICKASPGREFFLQHYTTERQYWPPHMRVCIAGTEIHFLNQNDSALAYDRAIYLDIFPLDFAPGSEKLQNRQKRKIARYKTLKRFKLRSPSRRSFLNCRSLCKSLIRAALRPVPFERINKWQDEAMQRYDASPGSQAVSMASHYSYEKQKMPAEVYGEPTTLYFTDGMYCVPNNYEDYLTRIYGDYMTPPPESERLSVTGKVAQVRYNDFVEGRLKARGGSEE